jgi:hypothetical protein
VLSLLIAPIASADINDGLDNMFMTTGNEPTIYQSQRRLGVDIGTLRLRAPINTFNVVNLTPPQFRSGCGGIDLYGGSFTFINAEQFRQMLRQIGANALGYAFKLALATMCEKCDSILTGLQEKIDALNKMQVDSCRWGQGLVNDFTDAMGFKVSEDAVQEGSASAMFADGFEALRSQFENPGDSLSGGNASGADPNNREDVGNYTWNALVVSGAGGRFNFVPGNMSHDEILMNIAGSYILRAPSAAEAEEGDVEEEIDRRLTYNELKYGKTPDTGGATNLLPLWECDENTQCLDPDDAGADWSFTGVSEWAETTLQAAADHMANPVTAGTDHAAAVQNFLATLPLTVVRHMQVMQGDQAALDAYVDHVHEYVGAAYSSSLALAMVEVVRAAYGRSDTPDMPPNVAANLLEFERDAKEDRRAVEREYSKVWRETEELVADLTRTYGQPGSLLSTKE